MNAQPVQSPVHRTVEADRAVLKVRDLVVSFDGQRGSEEGVVGGGRGAAVNGVSLTIYPRQTLALVGESGCGKSVTAMSLLGLIPRPAGRIERGSAMFESDAGTCDLLKISDREMRAIRGNEIAMVFQEPMTSLNPVLSVGDQIREAVLLHRSVGKGEAQEIAEHAMREVGIDDARARMRAYPHQFSGGMRQRVMIAMALACEPRLLLADEPTTALDVTVQAQILGVVSEAKKRRGMSALLVTHDLGVVAEQADVVCVMYAGRVVEYADVHTLFESPRHPYTRGLLACIPGMGQVNDRLRTIDEVMSGPGAFELSDRTGTVTARAWWPGRAAGDDSYRLEEITPGHWVALWGADAAEASGAPDLAYRVDRVGNQARDDRAH